MKRYAAPELVYSSSMRPALIPAHTTLSGQYITLEPLALRHAGDLASLGQHADAQRMFRYLPSDSPPQSVHDMEQWIRTKLTVSDPLFFACVDPITGQAYGRQSLMRIVPEHGVIEIGSILWGPAMARSSRSTEAFFLMASYVFDTLGYRRFEWKCDALNEPSRYAAVRFGFQFEGLFRQHMWVKGQNRDTAWYSILDSEWAKLRNGYERWLSTDNQTDAGQQRERLGEFFR
jgi:RimJ/RimL family protein N-acetyltransferase